MGFRVARDPAGHCRRSRRLELYRTVLDGAMIEDDPAATDT